MLTRSPWVFALAGVLDAAGQARAVQEERTLRQVGATFGLTAEQARRLMQIDEREIVIRTASARQAIERSRDSQVHALTLQLDSVRRQVTLGKQGNDALRQQLLEAQDRLLQRLTDTDPEFAVERAAFVSTISSLFASKDARVIELIQRYANGDTTALTELQSRLAASTAPLAERIVDLHAVATLLIDAAQKKERDTTDAIRAYEDVLKLDPKDYHALEFLPSLYLATDQVAQADAMVSRLINREREMGIDKDPTIASGELVQQAEVAFARHDATRARSLYQHAVALSRSVASKPYEVWRRENPGATEPERVVTAWQRRALATPLLSYADFLQNSRNYNEAAAAYLETLSLYELIINDYKSEPLAGIEIDYWMAMNMAVFYGNALVAMNQPRQALSAYRRSLAIYSSMPVREGVRNGPPKPQTFVLLPLAKAAILAGDLDVAEKSLEEARTAIKAAEPTSDAVGNEGLYWLEFGDLAWARGQRDQAHRSWSNAEAALTQAASLDTADPNLRSAITAVEERLKR